MEYPSKKWTASDLSNSLLFRTFVERAGKIVGKPALLYKLARKALSIADNDKDFRIVAKQAYASVVQLVGLIRAYASGEYREVSKTNIVLVIAAIIYFISPVDLVPDFIPAIGFLDDVTIIGWVLSTISEELKKFNSFTDSNKTDYAGLSYQELYQRAKELQLTGRAGMSRQDLIDSLQSSPATRGQAR